MCTALPVVEDTTDNETFPKYCDYHKFLLVEELALEPDYLTLHYGKCSIIGKLRLDANPHVLLENVSLNCLPNEYILPEGALDIRLLYFQSHGDVMRHGCYYQIYGEVVILDLNNPQNNHTPKKTCDVHQLLRRLPNDAARKTWLTELQATHKPAVNAWYVNEIDCAEKLIEKNLQIRQLIAQHVQDI